MRTRLALAAALLPFVAAGCDTTTDGPDAPDALRAFRPGAYSVLHADDDAFDRLSLIGRDSLNTTVVLGRLGVAAGAATEAYVAADTTASAPGEIVFTGRFDVAALTDGAGAGAYRDVPIVTVPGPDGDVSSVGVTRGALYVAPSEAALRALLDRRAGAAPSLADDAAAARLGGRVAAADIGVLFPGGGALRGLLGAPFAGPLPVRASALVFALPPAGPSPSLNGTAWLAPSPGTPARVLALALDAAIVAARAVPDAPPEVQAVLASLDVETDGADVRVAFTVPVGFRAAGR